MSGLFFDPKPKKVKRSEMLSEALFAVNSIHMLLVFGLLLVLASAIFLALPREDVFDLGPLRIILELFLLALTLLGAVVLYRPYRHMSRSVMLIGNMVLIAAVMGIKHQFGIETSYPKIMLGLALLVLPILFLVEARLYQFRLLGGVSGLCFLIAPALLVPSDLMLTGSLTAAAVLLILVSNEPIQKSIQSFVPVQAVLNLIYIVVPIVLFGEIIRDLAYISHYRDFPPLLMLSTWFAGGLFFLVDAHISDSDNAVSIGVLLLGLGTLAVELVYNPLYGGVAWLIGAVLVLLGALDIYLQDCENDLLSRYGRAFTLAGSILTTIGLLYSALMHPSDVITFSGLNLMEVISHATVLGLTHPPAVLLIVGSIVLFGAATGLTRRSHELIGALASFSLLYLYGLNWLVESVQSPDITGYLGWLLFPLAAGMIGTGLYGDWFRARWGSVFPYLGFGGLWAIVSTILTVAELQNVQGALLFALYSAIAAYAAYQTGLRFLTATSSTFAALTISYFLLPTGLQPGHIALILLVVAFTFYLLSLIFFLAESTLPLGYTLHLIGISMLTLAAFFALAWIKVTPEVFTLAIALGSLVIAIEYFRRRDFTLGYAALTLAMAAFWITIYYLPDSVEKLQFYSMSIGAYAIATHILLRHKGNQDGATTAGLGAMVAVFAPTFYQLFIMPTNNHMPYFGMLVIQVSVLFFIGLFLHSRLFVTIPLGIFLVALVIQLLFFLWEAGSGGLVSIILIMTVIGVPAIMAGITLAVARDSLLRAGKLFQDQLEEWNL